MTDIKNRKLSTIMPRGGNNAPHMRKKPVVINVAFDRSNTLYRKPTDQLFDQTRPTLEALQKNLQNLVEQFSQAGIPAIANIFIATNGVADKAKEQLSPVQDIIPEDHIFAAEKTEDKSKPTHTLMKMFYKTLQQSNKETDIDLKDAQIIQLYVANAPLKKDEDKADKERGFVQSTADNWPDVTTSTDSLEKIVEETREGFITKSAYAAPSLQEGMHDSSGDELNVAFFSIKEIENYKKYPDLEEEKADIDHQIHYGFRQLDTYLGSELQRIAAKHDIAFQPTSMDEFMS